MSFLPARLRWQLARLRLRALLTAAGVLAAGLLSAGSASAQSLPAPTAEVLPFPTGEGIVFITQGYDTNKSGAYTDSMLYTAVTAGDGTTTFTPSPNASSIQYNAVGFHPSDMYLYGFQTGTNNLVRIGQNGVVQVLGAVTGGGIVTAANNGSLNAGAFGDDTCTLADCTDILFVRAGSNSTPYTTLLYEVNINTMTATSQTLSQAVPNTADLTFSQGYLWSVYGAGNGTVTVYRIDPATGTVTVFNNGQLPGTTTTKTISTTAVIDQSYGAQWTYGNGDIGIAGNTTGV
ncbi:MAG: hypothetical protein LBH10_06505, partial [Burkholderiaceae bacterium]|nr:hypothetical protein [Burkholderiaceae bacterium]